MKQLADDRRVIADFKEFNDAYMKVYVPNQTIRQAFLENELKQEAELMSKVMDMLSHQFHKSKYPEHYNGDKQDEIGFQRDYKQ